MADYLQPPVENDPEAFKQDSYDYIAARVDGWEPSPGHEATLIIEAWAEKEAERADVVSGVLTTIFRYFGGLVGVPPIDAQPATATAAFTVQDTAGYTIPAGSVIGLRDPDGNLQGFDLAADVVIASGASTGSGTVLAETLGIAANGLSGTAELVAVPAFVTAAAVSTPTASGAEAEDDAVHLNRLTETLTTLSPRPILPVDFSILARSYPGVFRATTVDNLKPGPPYSGTAEATGQALTVTTAITDIDGQPLSSTIRDAVQALLVGMREAGFAVYVVDPQYTSIDVTTTVQAQPGYDASDVQSRVEAALAAFLDPATYGAPAGNTADWENAPVIRIGDLYAAIYAVEGVRYVSALTFGVTGGGLAGTNVTLGAGSAIPALPTTGTLSVTVTT